MHYINIPQCTILWQKYAHMYIFLLQNGALLDSAIGLGTHSLRVVSSSYFEGILPKGPYPPCLRMADRALSAGYPRFERCYNSLTLVTTVKYDCGSTTLAYTYTKTTFPLTRKSINGTLVSHWGWWRVFCHNQISMFIIFALHIMHECMHEWFLHAW